MTFTEAQQRAMNGEAFGDVWEALSEFDKLLFKAWWLYTKGVPVLNRNGSAKPHKQDHGTRELGYTGDVCKNCGGSRMRRNGPGCLCCDECGETTGCS